MEIWKFWKGPGIYLGCHNYECYSSTVRKGGKAAVGGCMGVVIKESHYLPPVLKEELMKTVNDVMDEWRIHASRGLLCTGWNECILAADEMDDPFRLSSWQVEVINCADQVAILVVSWQMNDICCGVDMISW